ncbi:MAG: DUF362 domain-containing protein [Chitinivibrionales bacterium]|nr:DUF362 domain-containing protein [Chitinivibrionales bacterium]
MARTAVAKAKVAIVATKPASVMDDTIRAFELAKGQTFLKKKIPTIIKDNISWHYPFPSANTTPWQLEATIVSLQKHGFSDISCVQNMTEVTNPYKGEKLNLYTPIFKAYDIAVLYNFLKKDMNWVSYKPKANMLVLNTIYENNIRIPDFFMGKNIVHLPTVKCHIYTTTTGAMKNAFGGLLNHKRHCTHTFIHETLVDLLAIQKEIHPGMFCIMDGTTAGNGTGPRIMQPVEKNVMLASADQVAIDAVAAKLMGFDPMSIRYIRLAHEAGLGVGKVSEIEIVGDAELAKQSWNFAVGKCFHQFAAWVAWFGPTKSFQKVLTRPPILYLGNFYSYFYHDIVHWPFTKRPVYKKWLSTSPWGALFTEYQKKGTLLK